MVIPYIHPSPRVANQVMREMNLVELTQKDTPYPKILPRLPGSFVDIIIFQDNYLSYSLFTQERIV